jgi:hypothetical protein
MKKEIQLNSDIRISSQVLLLQELMDLLSNSKIKTTRITDVWPSALNCDPITYSILLSQSFNYGIENRA